MGLIRGEPGFESFKGFLKGFKARGRFLLNIGQIVSHAAKGIDGKNGYKAF